MTYQSNPFDRCRQGQAKRAFLTDKNGLAVSLEISSASTNIKEINRYDGKFVY
jgi:hypothetical protein